MRIHADPGSGFRSWSDSRQKKLNFTRKIRIPNKNPDPDPGQSNQCGSMRILIHNTAVSTHAAPTHTLNVWPENWTRHWMIDWHCLLIGCRWPWCPRTAPGSTSSPRRRLTLTSPPLLRRIRNNTSTHHQRALVMYYVKPLNSYWDRLKMSY